MHQLGFVASAITTPEQSGIPDLVQVGRLELSGSELKAVAPAVVPISDVHRLVQVLDQVDEETQGLAASGARGAAIGEDSPEFRDLGDDAS
jgi:hypothetical protein